MDEIEIKRGDANGEDQHCGDKDPQDALKHYAGVLWNHNGLTPIGAAFNRAGAIVLRKASVRSELHGRVYN
jgi:hypothetical protein